MRERSRVCVIAGWPIRLPHRYYYVVFLPSTIGIVINIKVKSQVRIRKESVWNVFTGVMSLGATSQRRAK